MLPPGRDLHGYKTAQQVIQRTTCGVNLGG
jgi:hypothetical protein